MNGEPAPTLSLTDAIAIIVGTVIGAGIYETTPLVAANTSGPAELLGVFALGGVCAVIGALCYAELGNVLNRTGGDFEYLRAAYGRHVAFVFAWMTFWVVQPASVGAIAFIFARYATELLPGLTAADYPLVAVAAVIALTATNVFGLQAGTLAQKILTILKCVGILIIVALGFSLLDAEFPSTTTQAPVSRPGLAFILVMYTYGGWNVIALVAAEVHDVKRNLVRAMLWGIGIVTVIYVLAVAAFEAALGHAVLGESGSAPAVIAQSVFGGAGSAFISALIVITCLANINATLLTNSRIFYAFGRRQRAFRWLARWHAGAPINSLMAQGAVTCALILILADGANSFQRLVVFSAPVFWLFFLLVALALFVLRRHAAPAHDGFHVPLYPYTPIAFCLLCAFMLNASTRYAMSMLGGEVLAIAGLLITGSVLAWVFRDEPGS